MIFVDEARILVQGGDGGNGCESFNRNKYMRFPTPDGGDGGKGGDVVVVSSRSVRTLLDFKFKQHHKAEKGGHASSNGKKGKRGKDCELRVPVGTIIRDDKTKLVIKDMDYDFQRVIIARGGKGGIGNEKQKVTTPPDKGEIFTVSLELKLVADVGIIGFPNAGKSTLISHISKVKSKIASYPFTTRQPILGVIEYDDMQFIVADLPGIIEGASQGKGLGDRFLRHAERAKILIHFIDMAGVEGRDPIEDYKKINCELETYGEPLLSKKKIVVANKADLPDSQANLERFKKEINVDILSVSAATGKGLDILKRMIKDQLCPENSQEL